MHQEAAAVHALTADDQRSLLDLARQTLFETLGNGRLPQCANPPPTWLTPCAVFVTLWRGDSGALRGCRGEIAAHYPLWEAVVQMTVAAATDDPRFHPVKLEEAPLLRIEISMLTPLVPIRPEQVAIGRHGLMIVLGWRRGLLLPQVAIEHGLDRLAFLRALCWKAGLPDDAWQKPEAQLFGFETVVWKET
jgi:AmmeMemoRadiSam system protein A